MARMVQPDPCAFTTPTVPTTGLVAASTGARAVFDPDESGAPQVPVVATTVNQAIRSVYGVALKMVDKHPELSKRARSAEF